MIFYPRLVLNWHCDDVPPACGRRIARGVQCENSTADGRQPPPKPCAVMLRSRIEHLDRVLQSRGIDPDAAFQLMIKSDNPDAESDTK